ncbi:MAG: hypothetical protein J6Z50_07080 [Fibrobacterales bacterium]|nr:hypothetical protein [Fibrobacterales bacterium]
MIDWAENPKEVLPMPSAKSLYARFSTCNKEEEVKSEFCKFFKVKLNAIKGIDHYSENVLFEFKYDKNFRQKNVVATVLAQTMYYVRWLKYGTSNLGIPPYICVIDKNEAFFAEIRKFEKFFTADDSKYDWDRAPSTPCPKLVEDLNDSKTIDSIQVFNLTLEAEEKAFVSMCENLMAQLSLNLMERKSISEVNFWEVYEHWNEKFGKYVQNGRKASEYFLADIEEGHSREFEDGKVMFDVGGGTWVEKIVHEKEYKTFWEMYDRVSPRDMVVIRQKSDRIIEDFRRRFHGDFYTPIEFAQKGLEYLAKEVGKEWWKSGKYRFWDMAGGTGNLEFNLPQEALQYCYISTIREDEAKYCKKIFPTATCFQYDYLNDDVMFLDGLLKMQYQKLPENLVSDLKNPELKWIVFINPPFKTANDTEKKVGKTSSDKVSMTKVRDSMTAEDYGEASRELYTQFLYRISKEFRDRETTLCLYSTLKYLNSNNDQKVRDGFFQYKFSRGFAFPVSTFNRSKEDKNKPDFPIGFLVWNLSKKAHLEDQNIKLDVFNGNVEKIGTKVIPSISRNKMLNKWCPRPDANIVMPVFTSAFKQQTKNKDVRDRVAPGFLCSVVSNGDDVQHQNNVEILSAPYANAGGFSATPENFEKAMVLLSMKLQPEAKWSNNRDSFYAPSVDLPVDFVNDCVVFAAFHQRNYTTSLKDIEHKGKTYRIVNNLFPFSMKEIGKWTFADKDFLAQMATEKEDRYLAKWLKGKTLSNEAQDVLDSARALYKKFYAEMHRTNWIDFMVKCWDVGLCQIKRSIANTDVAKEEMKALNNAEERLHEKLKPKVYEYGFLSPDVELFK